jgi:hypothetical protein
MKQDLRFLLTEPFGGLRKETLDKLEVVVKQEILYFYLFCEKYSLKNKNIYGDTLHAKSKYDDVFTTEELLTIYLEQK